MSSIEEVQVGNRSPELLAEVAGPEVSRRIARILEDAPRWLQSRAIWNVNSTARGGGVAEMLQSLLSYIRAMGIDGRWVTISGDDPFFRITKRIHNAHHGGEGDGLPLEDEQRRHYESVTRRNAEELVGRVNPRDVVILHDPQTAGMVQPLVERGCRVVWRCHIGADETNQEVELAWRFLRPYLDGAHGYIFSRQRYIPDFLPPDRCVVVPPCIDPLSPKNQPMEPEVAKSIAMHTGVIAAGQNGAPRIFRREDGSVGTVESMAHTIHLGELPPASARLVVQVSRWDSLKDPIGVLRGFQRAVDLGIPDDAYLMLVGPDVRAVADDPEGLAVFQEVLDAWRSLPESLRQRVALVNLPMTDIEENAAMVNAIQRHAAIVIQKSLREGFGLTVTEAMWKSRPLVASRVGGIADQIEDGVSGLLLDDPESPEQFAAALQRLLGDQPFADRLGTNAHQRVLDHYLCDRHFRQYAELLERLD